MYTCVCNREKVGLQWDNPSTRLQDSVARNALYNVLFELDVTKKLVMLIKMCLSETFYKIRIGKSFLFRMG